MGIDCAAFVCTLGGVAAQACADVDGRSIQVTDSTSGAGLVSEGVDRDVMGQCGQPGGAATCVFGGVPLQEGVNVDGLYPVDCQ